MANLMLQIVFEHYYTGLWLHADFSGEEKCSSQPGAE
jgi:hypothetical protein